jgi:hypothetical protein
MSSELDAAKGRVKRSVLGRGGVHGVGLRRDANQVVLYAAASGASDEILAAARDAAAPCQVVVVEEERPVVSTAGAPAPTDD